MTAPKPLTDLTNEEHDNLRNALTIWLRGEPWILVCDLRRAVGYVVAERDRLAAKLAEYDRISADSQECFIAGMRQMEKAERERDEARALLRDVYERPSPCWQDHLPRGWRARVAAALGEDGGR